MEAFKNHCKCTLCSCDTVLSIPFEAFFPQKCVACECPPWTWYTRYTLACQRAYSLSKTPSRFFEKYENLYYSYVDEIQFSTQEFKNGDFDEMNHASNIENLTENLFIAMS